MNIKNICQTCLDRFIKALTALSILLLIPMMFLVPADVIGRYIFKTPIPAVFEINASFLMVAVVFFPLAFVHQKRGHIYVNLFTRKLPNKVKNILDLFSLVLGIVAYALIGWFGLEMAIESTKVREYVSGIINLPIWISKWFIPIGCLAFCLELIRDGLSRAANLNPKQDREA
jgi:TRAP-type C4-dicarboxylate transport system permease small subunit